MKGCLLSVDWDYFINTGKENRGSYLENKNSIINLWYKRYIQFKKQGRDIQKLFCLSSKVNSFWNKIRKKFCWDKNTKIFISDSHALSYNIAKSKGCTKVYLFDAHADLGYGWLPALNFELNCANWLGKLLQEKVIKEANIIYSPFTLEKPEDFKKINNVFSVKYHTWDTIPEHIAVGVIHICRSGAWTPPWYDHKFVKFVKTIGLPVKNIGLKPRKWDTTKKLSLAEQITYMMS